MLRRTPWIAVLVVGAALAAREDSGSLSFPEKLEWRPVFEGIDHAAITLEKPRPMQAHALRVDLTAPDVEVVTTPGNGEREGETDGWKTSTFLEKMRCQAAVNGAPFSPIHAREGLAQDVSGLLVHDGVVISPSSERYPVLRFGKDGRARIEAKPPSVLDDVRAAVAGFHVVLEDGRVVAKPSDVLHPRTAAGVADDGKVLFLLVIDGRQRGYSEGASTHEVGEFLRFLGATDGINLDGGGTTTMVLADEKGKAKVVNRPIHAGLPGTERVAACHLGVRARPLAEESSEGPGGGEGVEERARRTGGRDRARRSGEWADEIRTSLQRPDLEPSRSLSGWR